MISEIVAQRNTVATTSQVTSATFTFPNPPVAGRVVVIAFSIGSPSATPISSVPFSMSTGKSLSVAGLGGYIYYKIANGSEGTSWTFNFDAAYNIAGVATVFDAVNSSPLGVTASNNGNSASESVSLGTLTKSNSLVLCAFHSQTASANVSSYSPSLTQIGFSSTSNGANANRSTTYLAYTLPSSVSAVSYTAAISSSQIWIAEAIEILAPPTTPKTYCFILR